MSFDTMRFVGPVVTVGDLTALQGLSESHLFSLFKTSELKFADWTLTSSQVRNLLLAGKNCFYQSRWFIMSISSFSYYFNKSLCTPNTHYHVKKFSLPCLFHCWIPSLYSFCEYTKLNVWESPYVWGQHKPAHSGLLTYFLFCFCLWGKLH